jgi:hypothetical protein
MSPIRRQKDEGWFDYFFRLYWIPLATAWIAAVSINRTFGWGIDAAEASIEGALLGAAIAVVLALATKRRKANQGY